jgi:hypothetical protein
MLKVGPKAFSSIAGERKIESGDAKTDSRVINAKFWHSLPVSADLHLGGDQGSIAFGTCALAGNSKAKKLLQPS